MSPLRAMLALAIILIPCHAAADNDTWREKGFVPFGEEIGDLRDSLWLNMDPVKRAIICRVGYQPFAIHSIWRATKIPEGRIRNAAHELEELKLVRLNGDVISPRDETARDKMRRFAEKWCASDDRCEIAH